MTDPTSTPVAKPPEGVGIIHTVNTPEGMAQLLERTREHVEATYKPETSLMQDPATNAIVPVILTHGGIHAIPQALFEPWRTNPVARTGTATLTSLDSFIAHVNRYKVASTSLFACDDRAKPSITAVYDYNDPTMTEDGTPADMGPIGPLPWFGRHRAVHAFPLSDEWKAWNAMNGKAMDMIAFAAFLEDRVIDVDSEVGMDSLNEDMKRYASAGGNTILATANRLMELSRGLKVVEESRFAQAESLSSGESALTFTSEHRDEQGSKLVVPNMFIIQIPVFLHGDAWRVAARLRYRKQNGTVVFWYDLWRIDRVFDAAFKEAITQAETETECPLYLGAPEAPAAINATYAQNQSGVAGAITR